MSDRTPDRRDFDPRFDKAFQPGYDASHDPVSAARGTAAFAAQFVETSAPAVRAATVATTAPSAPADGPRAAPAAHTADGHDQPGHAAPSSVAEAPPMSVRNPFLLAIWGATAVFLLAGFALLRWLPTVSQQTQTSTGSNYDYLIVQAVVIGAPLLITLGLTTAVGSVFLFAARWRPREAG